MGEKLASKTVKFRSSAFGLPTTRSRNRGVLDQSHTDASRGLRSAMILSEVFIQHRAGRVRFRQRRCTRR